MSFQHTLYLKRDSEEVRDLPEHLDGIKYHWQCGARALTTCLEHFGTKTSESYYEFNSHQIARFLAALMSEFMTHYAVYIKAHNDFIENVKYNEDSKADIKCIDSYAILREADNEIEEQSHHYYGSFENPQRMFNIIKGLTSLTMRMKEDDVLIWEAG